MNKFLCLNTPFTALLLHSPISENPSGFSTVVGRLNHLGHDTTFLDLNAFLARQQREQYTRDQFLSLVEDKEKVLHRDVFEFLSDINNINGFAAGTLQHEKLEKWISDSIEFITSNSDDLNTYDAVIYSSQYHGPEPSRSVVAMAFLLILNTRIQRSLKRIVPSYVGGGFLRTLKTHVENCPEYFECVNLKKIIFPTRLFAGSEEHLFPSYLTEHLAKDKKLPIQIGNKTLKFDRLPETTNKQTSLIFQRIFKFPNNKEDLFVDVDKWLPDSLLQSFPELKNINPFGIARYTFTNGCPFNCSFCEEGPGKNFEVVSMSEAIDGLKQIEDEGYKHVKFFNTNINWSLKWVDEFCNEIIKNNINVKWTDSANFTVTTKDMFFAMKEAGCTKLWFGAETVVDRILKLNNKKLTKEKMIESLNWSNEAGIWNQCNFITNFPTETAQEFRETAEFIRKYSNEGLINGYMVNKFFIKGRCGYFLTPRKYGVKLHENGNLKIVDARELRLYDELSGKKWDQIMREANKKQQIIQRTNSLPDFRLHQESDYLFFALHDLYDGNKQKISEILTYVDEHDMIDIISSSYRETTKMLRSVMWNTYEGFEEDYSEVVNRQR